MNERRTDLAVEAKQLWEQSAQKTTRLPGVVAREEEGQGYHITRVEITGPEGERALHKARGNYITLEMPNLCRREKTDYLAAAELLAAQLQTLLPKEPAAPVLVVGLGNRAMTPDAIGPRALGSLLVTRHLIENLPEQFGTLRPVTALATGVMGDTGAESGELVLGVVRQLKPALVIALDALASRETGRLFTTVQLTDTGISPGSGVGNHRAALDLESLGVPVIGVGVPTVVEAATLCADLLEQAGIEAPTVEVARGLFVTPRDVDSSVVTVSKVLGLGISRALQPGLTLEDIEMLLA